MIVLRPKTNQLKDILPLVEQIREALASIRRGETADVT
jgi:hypothetical protein